MRTAPGSTTDVAGSAPIVAVPSMVPAGPADPRRHDRVVGPRLDQRLARPGEVEIHDPPGVVADPVDDLRRRACPDESVSVGSSTTRWTSSGRSSAMTPHDAEWPSRARTPWWKPVPHSGWSPHGQGRVDAQRPAGRLQAPLRAAYEAAAGVGLVELQRVEALAPGPCAAPEIVVEQPDDAERVQHEPPADQARGVGEPVGWPGRGAAAAGVPMPLAARTTTSAAGKCSRPRGRPIPRRGQAVARRATTRRTRAPVTSRTPPATAGPVGRSVDAFAPSRSPTGRPPAARTAAGVVRTGRDGVGARPPVPAEPVVRPATRRPGLGEGNGRHRRVRRRAGRPGRPPSPETPKSARPGRSTAAGRRR